MKHVRDFLLITVWLVTTLGAQPTLLGPGMSIEGQLQAEQSDEYRFTLQKGEYTRVAVEQRSINVALACFGPDGKQLWSADSFDIGDAETAELVGEAAGTYRLQISASDPHAPIGRYEVTLASPEPATERHQRRIAAAREFTEGMTLFRQDTREAMVQATGRFKESLANWREAGDHVEEARALYTIALTYIEIADEKQALEYANASLMSAQAAHDRKTEGRALNSLAEVQNYFGDKRKAIEYYEQDRKSTRLNSSH